MTTVAAAAEPIVLVVYGQPAPQGSKTAYVRSGRAVVTEGGSKGARASHTAWRQAVATAARDWQDAHRAVLLDEPVAVDITFLLAKPASVPKRRQWPAVKPDLDKLARAVLDSITGLLIRDDSRVVELHVRKRYAADEPPGCVVVITPLDSR